MKTAAKLIACLALLICTSGCAQLRAFEQTLEDAGIARFDSSAATDSDNGRSVTVKASATARQQGRAAVISPRHVITVAHVVRGASALIRTTAQGGWVEAKVVRRIPAQPEALVVLELPVDGGVFGALLGFSGFSAGDCYAPTQGVPAQVVTARGLRPWKPGVLVPGDSGSPVLDAFGQLVGLVTGRRGAAALPVHTPVVSALQAYAGTVANRG
jgi:S1-C subfamily serine protease